MPPAWPFTRSRTRYEAFLSTFAGLHMGHDLGEIGMRALLPGFLQHTNGFLGIAFGAVDAGRDEGGWHQCGVEALGAQRQIAGRGFLGVFKCQGLGGDRSPPACGSSPPWTEDRTSPAAAR